MNRKPYNNKRLKIELLHLGGVLTHTSKGSTRKPLMRRRYNMVTNQSLRDKGRYGYNSLSHNIYHVRDSIADFLHNHPAFVSILMVLGTILASIFALVYIYYLLHFVCLIDDACFTQNYGVING